MLLLLQSNLLLLPTCKGTEVIRVRDIVRIEAISNYSKIYFSNRKTLVVAKVLRWFEENLPSAQFIRIHRTHLVNKYSIYQYCKEGGGKLELLNGEWVGVSRRKKNFVLQFLLSVAA